VTGLHGDDRVLSLIHFAPVATHDHGRKIAKNEFGRFGHIDMGRQDNIRCARRSETPRSNRPTRAELQIASAFLADAEPAWRLRGVQDRHES